MVLQKARLGILLRYLMAGQLDRKSNGSPKIINSTIFKKGCFCRTIHKNNLVRDISHKVIFLFSIY